MSRITLHSFITREAAVCSRMKPKFIIATEETHHMRYSVSGNGRQAATNSHLVDNITNKSLCGRRADDWYKMEWVTGRPECLSCRKKSGRLED
jgi:hypothetical protein